MQLAEAGDQLIGNVLGMRGHKAHARNIQLIEPVKQLRKVRAAAHIGVDILAQQHDFLNAAVGQRLGLLDNFVHIAAALPPAHIGHDAIGAVIIAAVHNVDVG